MHVMSSTDNGVTWDFEHTIDLDTDLREPRLINYKRSIAASLFPGWRHYDRI